MHTQWYGYVVCRGNSFIKYSSDDNEKVLFTLRVPQPDYRTIKNSGFRNTHWEPKLGPGDTDTTCKLTKIQLVPTYGYEHPGVQFELF